MKVVKKISFTLLALFVVSFAGFIGYNKWKADKENETVYSEELEKTKGILKIRLGDDIGNYSGFDTIAAQDVMGKNKVAHWVYCGRGADYNSVGGFAVRTLSMEKTKLDIENPDLFKTMEHALGCGDKFVFIFTIKNKIAGIKVQVDETGGRNFNPILEDIYGPTARSNKLKNEIELAIQDGQSVSWESPSVKLVSKNVLVPRYSKNGNVYATDSYKELFYKYKPLINSATNDDATTKEADAVRNSL